MNRFSAISLMALAIGISTASSAQSADLGGGSKDPTSADYTAPASSHWSGFVITGTIGYADRDLDASRSITSETGIYREDLNGPDRCDGFSCFDSATGTYVSQASFLAANPGYDITADNTADPVRYELPLIESLFSGDSDHDSDGLQGGAELGYRQQLGRWLIEGAVGVSIDGNSETSETYATTHNLTLDPSGALGGPVPIGTGTGVATLSTEKEGDVYAVLRAGHLFGENERFLLGIGGGIVAGRFNVKGSHAFDGDAGGVFSTAYSETEDSVGYILEAFAKYKIDRSWDVGLLGQYKDFGTLNAGGNAAGFDTNTSPGIYARANDSVSIDASEWVIKGTLTYTIGN